MESVAPPYSLQLWPLAAVGCCGLFALLAPGCAPAVAALRLGFSVRIGSTSRLMASVCKLRACDQRLYAAPIRHYSIYTFILAYIHAILSLFLRPLS